MSKRVDYSNKSNFEIDVAIADLLKIKWHCRPSELTPSWLYSSNYSEIEGDSVELPRYTSDPAAMMPIVFDNNITIELSRNSLYEAYATINGKRFGIQFVDVSLALRAAAICFLEMMESKNVDR